MRLPPLTPAEREISVQRAIKHIPVTPQPQWAATMTPVGQGDAYMLVAGTAPDGNGVKIAVEQDGSARLSDETVDRIAHRVVELLNADNAPRPRDHRVHPELHKAGWYCEVCQSKLRMDAGGTRWMHCAPSAATENVE